MSVTARRWVFALAWWAAGVLYTIFGLGTLDGDTPATNRIPP